MMTAQDANSIFRRGLAAFKQYAEGPGLKSDDGTHGKYEGTFPLPHEEMITRSPIFQFGAKIDTEVEADIKKAPQFIVDAATGKLILPFDCFRIALPPGDKAMSTYTNSKDSDVWYAVVQSGAWTVVFQARERLRGSPYPDLGNEGLSIAICHYSIEDGEIKAIVKGFADANLTSGTLMNLNADSSEKFKDYVKEAVSHNLRWLDTFVWCLNSPATHVVKRDPTKPGKSVEWRESRSRYIILDSHEVREIQTGSLRAENQGTLTRVAHERRAHLKFLSSEKFVNKRGQWVPVKSAWVGPEEWKGKSWDGEVIYKLAKNFKPGKPQHKEQNESTEKDSKGLDA